MMNVSFGCQDNYIDMVMKNSQSYGYIDNNQLFVANNDAFVILLNLNNGKIYAKNKQFEDKEILIARCFSEFICYLGTAYQCYHENRMDDFMDFVAKNNNKDLLYFWESLLLY